MSSKATEPVVTPLVADGLALRVKFEAKKKEFDAKADELRAVEQELRGIGAEIGAVENQLIELGAGPYADEAGGRCTVVAGFPQKPGQDTFVLPSGADARAKELAGPLLKKLFEVKQVFVPKHGFDVIADMVLPKKAARELVALCRVEGKPYGGRAACVRWLK